jgi:GNAT superfamily N-acetyltransferase
MVVRSESLGADALFQDSLEAIGAEEGYLGSMSFVDGLLRVLVSDWMDALGSGTATVDVAKKLADETAGILFGEVAGYGKVPGWSKAGGIDVYVASQIGTPDTGRDAIENALVQMLMQATSIAKYADEPGVLEEQWKWQVDAMFEEYVNLFLGIPGEDPDGPEFGPADEPSEPLTEGWVTINTGDDDEGGQRVYIDGSGKMQSGAFKGKTFDQAFGKGKVKAKRDEDQSEPPPAESPKTTAPDPKPADAPAGDGKPKLAKPKAKAKVALTPESVKSAIDTAIGNPPQSKARVFYGNKADQTAKDLIGDRSIASLVGAPDDAEVSVRHPNSGAVLGSDQLEISVTGPGIGNMRRYLFRSKDGKLVMSNGGIILDKAYQGQGLGTKIFTQQIANAKAAGIERIDTLAEREDDKNGYYTWARLGYDGEIDKGTMKDFSSQKLLKEKFPKATHVRHLMATKEGRDFWKEHGGDFEAEFDLSDDSYSMKTLGAYLAAKAKTNG